MRGAPPPETRLAFRSDGPEPRVTRLDDPITSGWSRAVSIRVPEFGLLCPLNTETAHETAQRARPQPKHGCSAGCAFDATTGAGKHAADVIAFDIHERA